MRTKTKLFVVIRIDGLIDSLEDAQNVVSVTKVLAHEEEAIREVERLNKLNGSKGIRYFWHATRYYPQNVN